jgi:hypothetical protein
VLHPLVELSAPIPNWTALHRLIVHCHLCFLLRTLRTFRLGLLLRAASTSSSETRGIQANFPPAPDRGTRHHRQAPSGPGSLQVYQGDLHFQIPVRPSNGSAGFSAVKYSCMSLLPSASNVYEQVCHTDWWSRTPLGAQRGRNRSETVRHDEIQVIFGSPGRHCFQHSHDARRDVPNNGFGSDLEATPGGFIQDVEG